MLFKKWMCMAFIILLCIPQTAYAQEQQQSQTELQDEIFEAVQLMQEIMKESYDRVEDKVREIIVDESLSYEMTMDNYYALDNPAEDLDYIAMIAAYTTIKGYYRNHAITSGMTLRQICDDFYDISYELHTFEEVTPLNIGTYEENEDGMFRRTGDFYVTDPEGILSYEYSLTDQDGIYQQSKTQVMVIPDTHTVTYATFCFEAISPEDFFDICQIPLYAMYDTTGDLTVGDVYDYRIKCLSDTVLGIYIKQNVFAKTRSGISYEDIEEYVYALPEDLAGNRVQLIKTALSLVGNVPYQRGGKASCAGYDMNWWTFTDENEQMGLDSSGFIQWCLLELGADDALIDTISDVSGLADSPYLYPVQKGELLPGDIGIINTGGEESGTVHAGIYLGNDEWIHCSPEKRTVIVGEYTGFHVFRRIPGIEGNDLYDPEIVTYSSTYNTSGYDYDEIYLLAQTICSEAWGEGMNGWIGVAEVIKNRVESPLFPDTIYEVVYAPNQFSNNERIASYEPPEEIIKVAMDVMSGQLSILNNPDVLFYKNPMITNQIPASEPVNWGRHEWYTYINHHAFYLID